MSTLRVQSWPLPAAEATLSPVSGEESVRDAADVGMRDLPRDAHLAVELRQVLGIASPQGGKELQRDRLPEPQDCLPERDFRGK